MNNQEHEMDNNNNKKRKNSSSNNEEETVPIPSFPLATTNHIDCLFSEQIPPSISAGQVQLQNTTDFPSSSLSSRLRETPLLQSPPQQQHSLTTLQQPPSVQNQPKPNQQIQQQHPLLGTTSNAFGQHSRVPQQFLLSEVDNNKNKNKNKKSKNISNNEEEEEEEEEEINANPIAERKSETVPIPFPWATDHRATVHTLDYLMLKNIAAISGEVQCKSCKTPTIFCYQLPKDFVEVRTSININKRDHGPFYNEYDWVNPNLPACTQCHKENSLKPVISDKKKSINWLFLFLGKMLGCCTLEQLKYFCKHTTKKHTGAKMSLLILLIILCPNNLIQKGFTVSDC